MPRWPKKETPKSIEEQANELSDEPVAENPQPEMQPISKSQEKRIISMSEAKKSEDKKSAAYLKELEKKHASEKESAQAKIAALEAKLAAMEGKPAGDYYAPLDVMLKDPRFGGPVRIMFAYDSIPNPKNPSQPIPRIGHLSVFPNALNYSEIDPVTKKFKPLCPDEGFKSRAIADKYRNGEIPFDIEYMFEEPIAGGGTEMVVKTVQLKDAVRYEQEKYYKRRRKGDKIHLMFMRELKDATS